MRLILLILFTFSLSYLFSQSQSGTNTIFKEPKPGETVKVVFNTSNHTSDYIGEFKDALINFKDQILSVHYDDTINTFTLFYDNTIKISTLIEIFSEYNIDYTQKPISTNAN